MGQAVTAMRAIVDTNVMVVANRQASQASLDCVEHCIVRLRALETTGKIVLDDDWHILGEYLDELSSAGQPGVGDAFFKWILRNRTNPERCEYHHITPIYESTTSGEPVSFEEFPDDPALNNFDRQDRKMAALAIISGAPIWNAVDADWWNHRIALQQHGIDADPARPDYFEPKV